LAPVPRPVAARLRGGVAALLLLLLAACAGAPEPVPPPAPPPAPGPGGPARVPADAARGTPDDVVARVGGGEIRLSDVGDFAIRYFRDQANEALTQLVDERILAAEASRLGVTVSSGLVERETEAELERREGRLRERLGPDVELEEFLSRRYGVTLERHRADVARLVRTRLLRDRVIRLHRMRMERVVAREAWFRSREAAEGATEAARRGADLARYGLAAGERSRRLPPPIGRGDPDPAGVGEILFALEPGDVTDPVEIEGDDGPRYHVFKVIRRIPARDLDWAAAPEDL